MLAARVHALVASAATAAVTAATAATAAFLARPGFVDRQVAAIMLLAAEARDRRRRLLVAGHLHKRKTLAAASFTVLDHLGIRTVPKEANNPSRLALLAE